LLLVFESKWVDMIQYVTLLANVLQQVTVFRLCDKVQKCAIHCSAYTLVCRLFVPLPSLGAGEITFSGCLSVRPYVTPESSWTWYFINCLWKFHQIYNFGVPRDRYELMRFWGQKIKIKTRYGQKGGGICIECYCSHRILTSLKLKRYALFTSAVWLWYCGPQVYYNFAYDLHICRLWLVGLWHVQFYVKFFAMQ